MSTPAPLFTPAPGAFLGKGLAFPLGVDAHGRIARASGEAKIEQSIWLLLSTALGERVMRPEIGCAAHDALFAPSNPATVAHVVDQVRRALVAQEPRIDVLEVKAETSEGASNVLLVRIDYRLRSNNAMKNLVYPFFIEEGV